MSDDPWWVNAIDGMASNYQKHRFWWMFLTMLTIANAPWWVAMLVVASLLVVAECSAFSEGMDRADKTPFGSDV